MKIRELNKWLKENDFDVKVKRGSDYVYEFATDTIEVVETSWLEMMDYIEYCYDLGLKYPIDANLLCLFHEIGHHETLLDMNDTICAIDMYLNKFITILPEGKLKYYLYYRLPTEKVATKWAINYINTHIDDIMKLEKRIWK